MTAVVMKQGLGQHAGRPPGPPPPPPPPPPGQEGSRSSLVTWRGHGGGPATPTSVIFDKQLDKISLWVEQWDHDLRCRILKKLLRESSYCELRLLWTVMQPILHRDFMYTASKQFPTQTFTPVSSHISREVNEQYVREQKPEYHRIQSAHLQLTSCRSVADFRLPSIGQRMSGRHVTLYRGPESRPRTQQGSPSTPNRVDLSSPSQSLQSPSRMSKLSYGSRSSGFSKSSTISKSTRLTIAASHTSNTITRNESFQDSALGLSRMTMSSSDNDIVSPCLRFLEMPIRRHMQEENSPRHGDRKLQGGLKSSTHEKVDVPISGSQVAPSVANALHPSPALTLQHSTSNLLLHDTTPTQYGRVKVRVKVKVRRPKKGPMALTASTPASAEVRAKEGNNVPDSEGIKLVGGGNALFPAEGRQVLHWYMTMWNGLQRNEFLHKLLLKLDPREHFYLSSLLSMLHHVDIVGQAPNHVALKILAFLAPTELCAAVRVSRRWYKLCNNNNIWKQKCREICLEIPVTCKNPNWKTVFKDNKEIVANWKTGNCTVVECKGHSDKVLSLTLDSARMATGSADRTIKIWDVRDGHCLQTLKGHNRGIWGLRFFTEDLIISASYDSTIKVWSLREGSCLRTLIGHEGPVWAIERKGNILASASQDGRAKIWDISRCLLISTLKGHGGPVFCVDLDDEGRHAITGSSDRTIRVWSTENGSQLRLIWVSSSVMAVSYSKGWIACSHGNCVSLYSKLGKLQLTYEEHLKRIECLMLKIKDPSEPTGLIISAGKDGAMKQWDLAKGTCSQTFAGSKAQVNCVHFDEMRIASAAYDNKIKIWDFTRPQPPPTSHSGRHGNDRVLHLNLNKN